MTFLFVAIGGFIGSCTRFYLSMIADKRLIGTWIANISGSILLAIVLRLYLNNDVSESLWLILGIGFCGSYTTFSTFGNEALQLFVDKNMKGAITYIISSFVIALFFVVGILNL